MASSHEMMVGKATPSSRARSARPRIPSGRARERATGNGPNGRVAVATLLGETPAAVATATSVVPERRAATQERTCSDVGVPGFG